jgi:hypothetical protein
VCPLRDEWAVGCTHLIMDDVILTPKLLHCLLQMGHIITKVFGSKIKSNILCHIHLSQKEWLTVVSKLPANADKPPEEEFFPKLKDTALQFGKQYC